MQLIDFNLVTLSENLPTLVALVGALIWLLVLLMPWQPWRIREHFVSNCSDIKSIKSNHFDDLTVLIPARNEAGVIGKTLRSLGDQGAPIKVILVDDNSTDRTTEVAQREIPDNCNLIIVHGLPLPEGWVGKTWALEQGLSKIDTSLILLIDADINLGPRIVQSLMQYKKRHNIKFLSLMVALDMEGLWQSILIPSFIYFFKLLYPFRLSNSANRFVAAGAGGCILTEVSLLKKIGGFEAIRGAIIDDCSLARQIKGIGHRTWIGLTRDATSSRSYRKLGDIWQMVARSAYTQLQKSVMLLLLCSIIIFLMFVFPLVAVFAADFVEAKLIGGIALIFMAISFLPTLRYYKLPVWLVLVFPLAGLMFLAMTWTSAVNHWFNRRNLWKGRVY